MIHVVLFEPEIPPNTGNIIRLCANVGAHLHLIEPLGFTLDDKRMRRAGLDYHEWASVKTHKSLAEMMQAMPESRYLFCETTGKVCYTDIEFRENDAIVFGPETRGLSDDVMQNVAPEHTCYLPMRENIRSLNLSNTVAVVVYEAWRQLSFK